MAGSIWAGVDEPAGRSSRASGTGAMATLGRWCRRDSWRLGVLAWWCVEQGGFAGRWANPRCRRKGHGGNPARPGRGWADGRAGLARGPGPPGDPDNYCLMSACADGFSRKWISSLSRPGGGDHSGHGLAEQLVEFRITSAPECFKFVSVRSAGNGLAVVVGGDGQAGRGLGVERAPVWVGL